VAAEQEKKLREADEQYRLRLILHMVAAAIIARPMPTTNIVVENRYGSAALPVAWDTLGKNLDMPVCQICETPNGVLHLCANGTWSARRHHALQRLQARVLRRCGMGECSVDHAPLCTHHRQPVRSAAGRSASSIRALPQTC